MLKLAMLGFVPYSAMLLVMLYDPAVNHAIGPLPAILFGAFWWTYAFAAAGIALYIYDLPVAQLLGPSRKLQRWASGRLLNRERRL